MKTLDERIMDAVRSHAAESDSRDEDSPQMWSLVVESFRSSMRWTVFGAIVLMLIFGGGAIYCGIQLFDTGDVAAKIEWFAIALALFLVFAILRLWYFMELVRLSLRRDLKKVELLLASVVEALRSTNK